MIKIKALFRTRYRICRDDYAGYEVQYKLWWWPFWMGCYGINTWPTLEDAKIALQQHKRSGNVVYEEVKK